MNIVNEKDGRVYVVSNNGVDRLCLGQVHSGRVFTSTGWTTVWHADASFTVVPVQLTGYIDEFSAICALLNHVARVVDHISDALEEASIRPLEKDET